MLPGITSALGGGLGSAALSQVGSTLGNLRGRSARPLSHWSSPLLTTIGVLALGALAVGIVILTVGALSPILPIAATGMAVALLASAIGLFIGAYYIKEFFQAKDLQESADELRQIEGAWHKDADAVSHSADRQEVVLDGLKAQEVKENRIIATLEQQVNTLKKSLEERELLTQSLQAQLAAFDKPTDNATSLVRTLSEKNQSLEADVKKLSTATHALEITNEEKEKQLQELHQEREQFEKLLSEFTSTINSGHAEHEAASASLLDRFQNLMEKQTNVVDMAQVAIQQLIAERSKLQDILLQVHHELDTVITPRTPEATRAIAEMQAKILDAQHAVDQEHMGGFLEKFIAALQNPRPELKEALLSLKDDFKRWKELEDMALQAASKAHDAAQELLKAGQFMHAETDRLRELAQKQRAEAEMAVAASRAKRAPQSAL